MSLTIEAGECLKKKGSAIVFTEPFQRTHEIIIFRYKASEAQKFLHSMGKNNLSVLVLVVFLKNLGRRRRRNYNLLA